MRYIKLYEDLNDVYKRIGSICGLEFDPKYFVDFTVLDISKLNRIGFESIEDSGLNYNPPWYGKICVNVDDNLHIMKKEDEWYYVRDMRRMNREVWYKCDQFDGLLDCLKKEFNLS